MKTVSKHLLQDVLDLYDVTIKHVQWREEGADLIGLKAAAYDRLVEHLQVIIDGDFEDIHSLP